MIYKVTPLYQLPVAFHPFFPLFFLPSFSFTELFFGHLLLYFSGLQKSLQMVIEALKLKDTYSLEGKL